LRTERGGVEDQPQPAPIIQRFFKLSARCG